ncbi:hypothetical protein QQ045_003032 [Rhodiola kirilowii]
MAEGNYSNLIDLRSVLQVSYMILQMVSPVTHAVGNCLKRVVVIISSVLFFQTPVSPLNSLGNKQLSSWLIRWILSPFSVQHFDKRAMIYRDWDSTCRSFSIFKGKEYKG